MNRTEDLERGEILVGMEPVFWLIRSTLQRGAQVHGLIHNAQRRRNLDLCAIDARQALEVWNALRGLLHAGAAEEAVRRDSVPEVPVPRLVAPVQARGKHYKRDEKTSIPQRRLFCSASRRSQGSWVRHFKQTAASRENALK